MLLFRILVIGFLFLFSSVFAQSEGKKSLSKELYESVVEGIERAVIKEKIGFFMTGSILGNASFNGIRAVSAIWKVPIGNHDSGRPFPFGGFPHYSHGYSLGNSHGSSTLIGFGYKKLFGDEKEFFFSSYTQLGLSYVVPYGGPVVYSNPGVVPLLTEAWVSLGKTKGFQTWGGLRSYKKVGTFIAGLLRRNWGIGVGVENINIKKDSPINLDIALISRADGVSFLSPIKNGAHQSPDTGGMFTQFHLDFQLEEILVGKAGKISFQLTPVITSGGIVINTPTTSTTPAGSPPPTPPATDAPKATNQIPPQVGLQFAMLYSGKHVMGYDKPGSLSGLFLQLGYGSGANFDPTVPNGFLLKQVPSQHKDLHLRGTYFALINCLSWLDVAFNAGLGWLKSDSGYPFSYKANTNGYAFYGSAGTRPTFYIKENFFVATEYGVDVVYQPEHIKEGTDAAASYKLFSGEENNFQVLNKFTVAPGLKIPGRFFANPVIYAFATIAFWNENLVPVFQKTPWENRQFAFTWGLQVKASF